MNLGAIAANGGGRRRVVWPREAALPVALAATPRSSAAQIRGCIDDEPPAPPQCPHHGITYRPGPLLAAPTLFLKRDSAGAVTGSAAHWQSPASGLSLSHGAASPTPADSPARDSESGVPVPVPVPVSLLG